MRYKNNLKTLQSKHVQKAMVSIKRITIYEKIDFILLKPSKLMKSLMFKKWLRPFS